MTELWEAIRVCELNVIFHRRKARQKAKLIQVLDVSSILLAAVAGIGILSGIASVPATFWAIVAFGSGVVNQLRPIFRLSDKMLEELTLENEYASLETYLQTLLNRVKDIGGLTTDVYSQIQLGSDRYRVLKLERDKTEYKASETKPILDDINLRYPKDRLWMPAKQSIIEGEEAKVELTK